MKKKMTKLVLYRFSIPDYTRDAIRKFDDGKGFNPAGYIFNPPSESGRIEARRKRNRVYAKARFHRDKAKTKAKSRSKSKGIVPEHAVLRDQVNGPRGGSRRYVVAHNGVLQVA